MICVQGLHEQVASIAASYLERDSRVLDVGTGRGAFALRMADEGRDVDACDIRDLCMCKHRVRFIHGSAESLEPARRYHAIFMLELLEHVEAPFEVIRKYAQHLEPGGYLIFSTPNVDSDLSRAWFFLTGRHWYFEPHNVAGDGHITPIHHFQVEKFLESAPFQLVARHDGPEGRRIRWGILKGLLGLMQVRRWLRRERPCRGASAIYVLKRQPAPGSED